jgi:hypothetical protein
MLCWPALLERLSITLPWRDFGERALAMAVRVLDHLEEKAAGYTALTIPVELKIQLDDKRKEVAALRSRIPSDTSGY